jgi:hypothetical protein
MLDGFSVRLWLDEDHRAVRRIFEDFKTLLLAAIHPHGRGAR